MADLTGVLALGMLIGLPLLILGFGSMINDDKGVKFLALVNFISILTYFTYTGDIAGWLAGLFILLLTLLFGFLFKSVLSEGT